MPVEDTPWSRTPLAELRAYRIAEIPRRRDTSAQESGNRDETDPGRPQRVAALMAAYHAGVAGPREGAVAFGWVRTAAGGPVHVLAAGDALAGSAACGGDATQVLLALPGGARGTALPPGELAKLLGRLGCWREIAAISDGLLAPAAEASRATTPGGTPRCHSTRDCWGAGPARSDGWSSPSPCGQRSYGPWPTRWQASSTWLRGRRIASLSGRWRRGA